MIDFGKIFEDDWYILIREIMIFSFKNNDFFNEFWMKMNDFATFLLHLYTGNDKNDDFGCKIMNSK